ncbi:MAG TPA: hypothetical protein VGQ83_30105 [Polyangia bacterium]|jgi:hypothetical protein
MTRTYRLVVAAFAAASLATLGGGCEGTSTGLICGLGTHAENSVCVPDQVQDDGGQVQQDTGPVQQDAGQTDAPKAKGDIGAPCALPTDCKSSMCLTTAIDARLTGGYCSQICSTNACPLGTACIPAGGMKVCFAYCDPGAPVCRDGYACQPAADAPTWGFCAPKCRADHPDDCPAGGVCAADGFCTTPPTCNPAAPSCATGKTCFPTSQSATGGYCFPDCTAATACKASEVCQPLAIGSTAGICVPPPCATNADCPIGATCAAQHDGLMACQPPATCETTCTDTTKSCIGGLCLAKCSAGATGDTECNTLQAGLACADTFGVCMPKCAGSGVCDIGYSCFATDDVCLPTGSFPGSECIPASTGHADPYCLPLPGDIAQACVMGQCTPVCATNHAICGLISSSLACYTDLGVCAPVGSFPGSDCRASGGATGQCDHNLKVGGVEFDLECFPAAGNLCLPACGNDWLCDTISGGTAVCMETLGAHTGGCLPKGSFPGSPCATGNVCANYGPLPQTCVGGLCVPTCNDANVATGDGLCAGVDQSLTCMPVTQTGDGYCVPKCDAIAACPSGMSCFQPAGSKPGAQNACLPTGAFPGSACPTPAAAHGGCGVYPVQMECYANTCLVPCSEAAPATGDAFCGAVDPSLTCMPMNPATGAGFCVLACVDARCDGDFTCYDAGSSPHQNTCLPIGSFPSSPCHAADGNHPLHPYCADYAGQTQSCRDLGPGPMCFIDCNYNSGGNALCVAVGGGVLHTCQPVDMSGNGVCIP